MDMWGVLPVDDRKFKVAVRDMTQLSREPLQLGMASCHSLTLINGVLSGDPLDVKVRLHETETVTCLEEFVFVSTSPLHYKENRATAGTLQ
jgi:hypothetical protein